MSDLCEVASSQCGREDLVVTAGRPVEPQLRDIDGDGNHVGHVEGFLQVCHVRVRVLVEADAAEAAAVRHQDVRRQRVICSKAMTVCVTAQSPRV